MSCARAGARSAPGPGCGHDRGVRRCGHDLYAPWYALAPLISRDSYGGAGLFGILESVAGAGAVLGAIVGIRWRPERPMRAGLLLSLAWPVMGAMFALHAPLALVVVSSLGTGFGFSLLMIWWNTALAQHIPPHALSRVSAYDWADRSR